MRNTTISFVALLVLVGCEPIDPKDLEDNDADGVLAIDDCNDEDPESTVVADDADCDGVLTADDCDDENIDAGSNVDDVDCDGVLAADDCDDGDAEIGIECPTCFAPFQLESTLIAHSPSSGTPPFIEGTAGRAIGIPDNPYTKLLTPDLFDGETGDELVFPTEGSLEEHVVFSNPQGLSDLSSNGNIYGSFVGAELDVNNPDEFYYKPETEQAFRHYKGGTFYVYGLDENGEADILASFNLIELLLIVEWGQIFLGDGDNALQMEVKLETIEDTTGVLGVDPTVPSVFIVSDDAVIQQDGVSENGQWAAYSSDSHSFETLSTSLDCEQEEEEDDDEECSMPDDIDCDGVLTADDCDDNDENIGSNADDGDCDGVATVDDCDDTDAGSTVVAEDGDCDGVLTADDCDDASVDVGSNADDADCDGVATAEDCDDASVDLGAIADDGDCDGVLVADDCDDADPALGADCPVCFDPFEMSSSLMAHQISYNTGPFLQGTNVRASVPNNNPYTQLISPDLFDEGTGLVLAYPSVDTPTSFEIEINNPQNLVPLNPGEGLYVSFSGPVLDVNNPNEFYYIEATEQSIRHYKGGDLYIHKLDAAGVVTTLATYSILDLVLTVEWGAIIAGNTAGGMHAEVYLDLISDTTGVLGVDPLIPSMTFVSDDAVVHVDGQSDLGPWELYTSSAQTFTPISASAPCP